MLLFIDLHAALTFETHSGVARESGVPALTFLVGNLSAARVSSKVAALQIKAMAEGLFPERYTLERQRSGAKTNGIH